MANHQSLLTASAVSLFLISGLGVPRLEVAAQTAVSPVDALSRTEKVEVRADEEKRIKSLDKNIVKQLDKQAKAYRKMAKEVEKMAKEAEKQGGKGPDPAPLLEAAAYYESQAAIEKAKQKNAKKAAKGLQGEAQVVASPM